MVWCLLFIFMMVTCCHHVPMELELCRTLDTDKHERPQGHQLVLHQQHFVIKLRDE